MYYTTKDISKILGISDSAVKYNSQKGKLKPSLERGVTKLYSKEDIMTFADSYGYKYDELNFYTREELMEMVRKMRINNE